jgi:hypothetical protein
MTHTKVRNLPPKKLIFYNRRVCSGSWHTSSCLVKARRKHLGKIHLAKLIIIPLFFPFFFFFFLFFLFFPLTLFHSGVILMDHFCMVNLLPQKKMQRSNGRSLSVSGWKWLATFIVDLDRPSDRWFGRCDKEWDGNWSRGVTGNFRRTCISGQNIPHTQKKNKNCTVFSKIQQKRTITWRPAGGPRNCRARSTC